MRSPAHGVTPKIYWHIFQRRAANLAENETGATLTRKWVSDLLNELLGYSLTYQQAGAVIGDKTYPISHRAGAGEESPPVDIEGVVSISTSALKNAAKVRRHSCR